MLNARVGLVVPSSNVTMEIEVPAVLRAAGAHDVSFHSARMRMRTVSAEELKAMDAQAAASVDSLLDAEVDVVAYACLVAVMVQGAGAHRAVESRLCDVATERGRTLPIVSSASALLETLKRAGISRVAMVTPYLPELTDMVIEYARAEGVATICSRSLGVPDNNEVGRIEATRLAAAARELDYQGVEALVLSACVQMPSLSLIEPMQRELGLPVLSAATATSAAILHALGRDTSGVPGLAGSVWGQSRPSVIDGAAVGMRAGATLDEQG